MTLDYPIVAIVPDSTCCCCCLLFVVVVCCLLFVVCCLLFVVYYFLPPFQNPTFQAFKTHRFESLPVEIHPDFGPRSL